MAMMRGATDWKAILCIIAGMAIGAVIRVML